MAAPSSLRRLSLSPAPVAAQVFIAARTQPYPTKPIVMVVAYPTGGDTDALVRILGRPTPVMSIASAV
ncbi:MAG: hypothetical protein QM674_00540 [Burkholderiaceae bacterium]